jgi:outer membrane receptor protein involved in Fe transport
LNKQYEIASNDRAFSREALYFYGSVFAGGSSRAPNGRISLPASLQGTFGCSSVIRREGAAGSALSDYRCFITSGASADFYNYQALNLIVTPQERGNVFALANYDINESVGAYAEFLYNRTTSGFKIAELPFDSRSDRVVIPANNVFNPFGVAFGGQPDQTGGVLNPNAVWRLQALGQRRSDNSTQVAQVNVGLKGSIGNSGWEWDGYVGYGRQERTTETDGYLFKPALTAAFGPNFRNAQGVPTCGTPAAPIANCTPVNIFNLTAPGQAAALGTISAAYNQTQVVTTKLAALNFNGKIFDLPAGEVLLAVGGGYSDLFTDFNTDALTTASPPKFNSCQLSGETCSADTIGGYDVSEMYAEVFVPLLTDKPGAKALNFSAGVRYSDYSNFGDTTNMTFKLEYRPVADLLVRGSYSEVFRAPQVIELFRGPTANAAQFNDPCVGLTAARVTANPNLALACANVPRNGTFTQPNSQVDGLFTGNANLQPETGEVVTWGLVYEPSAISGLSMNVDVWKYTLEDVITALDVNFIADQCVQTGSAAFCGFIARFSDGSIDQIQQPTFNLGSLETNGVDFGVSYRLNTDGWGQFRFGINATLLDSYENVAGPGAVPQEIKGTWDRQFGHYAEWRGTGTVGWSRGPFEGLVTARYIDGIRLIDPDGAPGIQPDLIIPSYTYLNLMLGYTWRENTKIQIGVDNIADKQPPIMYQNNVLNANTDVNTYSTIGRYMWINMKHKFN